MTKCFGTGEQLTVDSVLYFVGFINVFAPINFIITYGDSGETQKAYLPFFTVWLCMSIAYYIISTYCVSKNKKIRDRLAADEENEEE